MRFKDAFVVVLVFVLCLIILHFFVNYEIKVIRAELVDYTKAQAQEISYETINDIEDAVTDTSNTIIKSISCEISYKNLKYKGICDKEVANAFRTYIEADTFISFYREVCLNNPRPNPEYCDVDAAENTLKITILGAEPSNKVVLR